MAIRWLSHNALIGQDDLSVLKEIYDSIQSIDLKQYSGIDEKVLEEFESMQLQPINEADIEFNEIRYFFNEKVFRLFERVIKKLDSIRLFQSQQLADFTPVGELFLKRFNLWEFSIN